MIKSFEKQIRPVVLGKIKIGKWVKGQSGQKFDHFKIVKVGRTQEGDIIEDIETTNHISSLMNIQKGQKITRIPIYFSGNTMDDVFDCWYSMRWGSKTLCMGNGITADRANISVNGAEPQNGGLKIAKGDEVEIDGTVTVPCADSPEGCPYYNPKPDAKSFCLMGAKLLFHIQGLTKRGGFFLFTTHSIHSTKNLYSGISQFEKMLCGHLSFLPFELVIEPQRNQNNQLIYVVHLEMVGDMQELRQKAIEAATVEMKFLKQMKEIRDEGVKLIAMKSEDISDDEGIKETEEYFRNEKIPESDAIKKAKTVEVVTQVEEMIVDMTTGEIIEENGVEEKRENDSIPSVPKSEPDPKPIPDPKPEPIQEPKPEPKVESTPEVKPEIKTQPVRAPVKRTVTRNSAPKVDPPDGMLF